MIFFKFLFFLIYPTLEKNKIKKNKLKNYAWSWAKCKDTNRKKYPRLRGYLAQPKLYC